MNLKYLLPLLLLLSGCPREKMNRQCASSNTWTNPMYKCETIGYREVCESDAPGTAEKAALGVLMMGPLGVVAAGLDSSSEKIICRKIPIERCGWEDAIFRCPN